jgi:hypothetical protein
LSPPFFCLADSSRTCSTFSPAYKRRRNLIICW